MQTHSTMAVVISASVVTASAHTPVKAITTREITVNRAMPRVDRRQAISPARMTKTGNGRPCSAFSIRPSRCSTGHFTSWKKGRRFCDIHWTPAWIHLSTGRT